jgi:Tfp pilus assembly PilM family ATPase/Tfp pilus assembly protein PilN
MKSNSVFYISEGIIKFFQVSGTQNKLVTAVDVINTSNQSDAEISQILKAFTKLRKLNYSESRVTVLIPRSRVILRLLVFPSQREDEIRSMIDLQVGSRIPFAREEVEIDFQILSKTADGYAKVAVVILPQEISMRYWKIFSDSKIPVQRITISSIGLWLLYQQQPEASDKLGAILDLDLNHSEICLCTKTHWLTSREIPVGFVQMQKDEYVEILKQWELTQNIAGEEKPARSVELVYLASSANRAYKLGLEMAKMHNDLTIKEIALTKTLSLARGVQWPKIITDDGMSVASLAGIAFSSETPPIDLIPKAVRQAQEQRVYKSQLVILGIWITAALISLGLALGMGFFKKNVQLARLEDQLRETKSDAIQVSNQLKKVNDIESMIKDRLIFSDLAHDIDRLLPTQVYLVSITISNGNTLSLQGVSSNSVEINQFQKDMVDSRNFSNVSLDYVNKRVTQQGEVDYFKITCTIKLGNGQK